MKVKFKKYWRKSGIKSKEDTNFLLKHIMQNEPRNFLEIGMFHGVTSRNVCEVLYSLHGNNFKFTGIDIFFNDDDIKHFKKDESLPSYIFSNPLKTLYYKYIIKLSVLSPSSY